MESLEGGIMNGHVNRFYRKFVDEVAPIRLYHEVIPLHDNPKLSWEEVSKKSEELPKGGLSFRS